jgi:very-short-patch-repair endonuclease
MQPMRIHNRPEFKYFRKKLRNNSTSAEAVLWIQLKHKQLQGGKFRRQHSIGNFIVDFYWPEEKLVIELDGEDHFWEKGIINDTKKTNYLSNLGIKTIRFENKWIFEDIDHVLTEISSHFKK